MLHLDQLIRIVIFEDLLRLFALPLPHLLPHLLLASEQFLVRLSISASESIPQRRILPVVEVKVQMVHRVARGAVDDFIIVCVFPVVDHDGPDVDKNEKENIRVFLQRKEKREHVVGNALHEAVERVERV